MLHFSAYTVANRPEADPVNGRPMPSTEFFWRNGDSLEDMLVLARNTYDRAFGLGGRRDPFGAPMAGREITLNMVRQIGQFFLASIVWLGQDILQTTPGHIERHRRKQIMREHKLKEPPTVKVIALRHVHYKHDGEDTDATSAARKYDKWQWVVDGHFRNQRCGPALTERRLAWIDPYVKGPDGRPMKPKPRKVFAVVR